MTVNIPGPDRDDGGSLTAQDGAVLRMLAGAIFEPGAQVVLPSGRVLDAAEAQALTSAYAPAFGQPPTAYEEIERRIHADHVAGHQRDLQQDSLRRQRRYWITLVPLSLLLIAIPIGVVVIMRTSPTYSAIYTHGPGILILTAVIGSWGAMQPHAPIRRGRPCVACSRPRGTSRSPTEPPMSNRAQTQQGYALAPGSGKSLPATVRGPVAAALWPPADTDLGQGCDQAKQAEQAVERRPGVKQGDRLPPLRCLQGRPGPTRVGKPQRWLNIDTAHQPRCPCGASNE